MLKPIRVCLHDDERETDPRYILLILDALVDRDQHVESVSLCHSKQCAIDESLPGHLADGANVDARQVSP